MFWLFVCFHLVCSVLSCFVLIVSVSVFVCLFVWLFLFLFCCLVCCWCVASKRGPESIFYIVTFWQSEVKISVLALWLVHCFCHNMGVGGCGRNPFFVARHFRGVEKMSSLFVIHRFVLALNAVHTVYICPHFECRARCVCACVLVFLFLFCFVCLYFCLVLFCFVFCFVFVLVLHWRSQDFIFNPTALFSL